MTEAPDALKVHVHAEHLQGKGEIELRGQRRVTLEDSRTDAPVFRDGSGVVCLVCGQKIAQRREQEQPLGNGVPCAVGQREVLVKFCLIFRSPDDLIQDCVKVDVLPVTDIEELIISICSRSITER